MTSSIKVSSSPGTLTSPSNHFCSFLAIISIAIFLVTLTSSSSGLLFFPKFTTRFCYNSPNATVTSQCVYCNYFTFDSTVLSCTGSSAITINITTTQAFCLIAQCLSQVRQTPVFLGRKKRSTEDQDHGQEAEPVEQLNVPTASADAWKLPPVLEGQALETVSFNGERFVVARQVNVEVIVPEVAEELDGNGVETDNGRDDVSDERETEVG